MGVKRWLLKKRFEFKYRKVDPDVCCCGASDCSGDYSHPYTNAKEYHIDLEVRRVLGLIV